MRIEAMKQAQKALENSYARLVKKCEENLCAYNGFDVDTLTQMQEAIIALRQAIEQPEQKPVAHTLNCVCGAVWDIKSDGSEEMAHTPDTTPPHRQPLTVEQAHDIGAKGGEPTESERLLFEAWMRGHCWKVCGTWDGKQYRSPTEVNGEVDYHAMHTRQLWAAWRDRAALEAAHGIKGEI